MQQGHALAVMAVRALVMGYAEMCLLTPACAEQRRHGNQNARKLRRKVSMG